MNKNIKISNVCPTSQELLPAIEVLKQGGVIAYPTETIYGLGANIYLESAIEKLYNIKGRDAGKPISALIASLQELEDLCDVVNESAAEIIKKFWPGPLTLIFKAGASCPVFLKSNDGKIGIRYPDHKISRLLVEYLGAPITSTSANLSGRAPATTAKDLAPELQTKLDIIIDAGASQIQTPSTVLDVSGAEPVLLRAGAIAFEHIMKSLKKG